MGLKKFVSDTTGVILKILATAGLGLALNACGAFEKQLANSSPILLNPIKTSTNPPSFVAPPVNLSYAQGEDVRPLESQLGVSNLAEISEVQPAFPMGLSMDMTTGLITGRASASFPKTTYAIRGTTLESSFTQTLTLEVHPSTHTGKTFYIANAGSDTNDGLSPAHAWQTVGKVNRAAQAGLFHPGDSLLFNRGDVWRDDYLRCANEVRTAPATTLQNTPLTCSGSAGAPLTISAYGSGANPLFDGANPLKTNWQDKTGGVFSAPISFVPANVYVDHVSEATTALLPVPNAAGNYAATSIFHYLDQVTDPVSSDTYICVSLSDCPAGGALKDRKLYLHMTNTAANNKSQSFSPTNTGLQNVQNTPGSWYLANGVIYVHLLDNSNPAQHALEGSVRPHGVYLESTNYVWVSNLSVERTTSAGIMAFAFSDPGPTGAFRTNEYITLDSNTLWNIGSNSVPGFPGQLFPGSALPMGAITADSIISKHNAVLQRGWVISNNDIGTFDMYYGLRGNNTAGIMANSMDDAKIHGNRVSPTNAMCIFYANASINNAGGDIAYNNCTNAQANLIIGHTNGGRIHHNVVHDSLGEGIQLGGTQVPEGMPISGNMLIDHNIIYNLGKAPSQVGFNGIDCNGIADSMIVRNNTIWNTNSANLTMEGQCTNMQVENNIFDQSGVTPDLYNYNAKSGGSHSFVLYIAPSVLAVGGWQFSHNLWNAGTNSKPFYNAYDCAGFLSAFPNPKTLCKVSPNFVDPVHGDFHLKPNSPALGASTLRGNLGAL